MSRIVFSPPLVAAILDGRKTMTRRVLTTKLIHGARFNGTERDGDWLFTKGCFYSKIRPPYKVGDRLAVAETHWAFGHWEHVQKKGRMGWQFVCDRPDDIRFEPVNAALPSMDRPDPGISTWYKRIARFMPTSYARLYIEVTAVRVERLHDITEADAIAEGVEPLDSEIFDHDWKICPQCGGTRLHGALGSNLGVMEVDCGDCDTHKKRFQHLWNSLHTAPDDWAGNPWVTAIKFRKVEGQR